MQVVLTPELLIEAYRQGLFPMAYDATSPYVHWICPEERGQLSIPDMHIPRSLSKLVRNKRPFEVRVNTDFPAVIHECAQLTDGRPETWINENIINAYIKLHRQGHAHSIECWKEIDGERQLVGGLYGIAIGGAFFGESMFSRVPNASKVALVHLAARLWKGGFKLLDTQFVNDHLLQFGIYELVHDDYMRTLGEVIDLESSFALEGVSEYELIKAYFKAR